LTYLEQIQDWGVYEVWFSGGEPFLTSWFLDVLERSFERGMRVGVTTTATVISDRALTLLSTHKRHLAQLNVSFHGHTPDLYRAMHGTRQLGIATRNLRKFKLAGVPFRINLVISRVNLGAVIDICRYAQHLGAERVNLLPVRPVGAALSTSDDVPEFAELLPLFRALDGDAASGAVPPISYVAQDVVARALKSEFPNLFIPVDSCSAHAMVQMDADGAMSLCTQLRDMNLGPATEERFLAKPREDASLKDAWTSPEFRDFRSNMYRSVRHEQCARCPSFAAGRCTPCSFRAPDCEGKLEAIQAFRRLGPPRHLAPPGEQ
jgi:MoaA/NifB/PqqE/SkfB family radical SAM enzyme